MYEESGERETREEPRMCPTDDMTMTACEMCVLRGYYCDRSPLCRTGDPRIAWPCFPVMSISNEICLGLLPRVRAARIPMHHRPAVLLFRVPASPPLGSLLRCPLASVSESCAPRPDGCSAARTAGRTRPLHLFFLCGTRSTELSRMSETAGGHREQRCLSRSVRRHC